MPEDNTNTPATLTLLPAAPKRKATKSDLVQMIAELEYQRRKAEAERLDKEMEAALNDLLEEGRKVLQKRLANGTISATDFEADTFCYRSFVKFEVCISDTPKMVALRKKLNACKTTYVSREDVLKEVRAKMEAHRTDHIRLALAEDPALRQGVEELRKQLFND